MRTDNPDILGLLSLYTENIDKANTVISGIEEEDYLRGDDKVTPVKGIVDSEVSANPNPILQRKDSLNIKYHGSKSSFLDKFVEVFRLDPFNTRQAVIINFNKSSKSYTVDLTNSIRKSLFGENSDNLFNEGDLLISLQMLKSSDKEVTLNNNERVVVKKAEKASNESGSSFKTVKAEGGNLDKQKRVYRMLWKTKVTSSSSSSLSMSFITSSACSSVNPSL
jgi:hypothetical protein